MDRNETLDEMGAENTDLQEILNFNRNLQEAHVCMEGHLSKRVCMHIQKPTDDVVISYDTNDDDDPIVAPTEYIDRSLTIVANS